MSSRRSSTSSVRAVRGGPLDLTRLAVEAAFLLLVATGAGFAGLGAAWIVLAVAAAWTLVAVVALEDRRLPPLGCAGTASLQAAVAPAEDELGALRPPAPEDAGQIRRCGLPRPPRLHLPLGVEHRPRELGSDGDRVEARGRVRE